MHRGEDLEQEQEQEQEQEEEENRSMLVDRTTTELYSSSYPLAESLTIDRSEELVEQVESTECSNETNEQISSKSLVWNYADKLPNGKAKCLKCNKEISIKDHSTTCLRRHVNRCQKLSIFSPKKNVQKSSSKISSDMKDRLDRLVYSCLIQDGRSFSDFQKPGIVRFLQEALPGIFDDLS